MGSVIDVTNATFQEEVLVRSLEKPVLVDFFAQWCGSCQLLKPLLEKLAGEYDFVLAKVDIDQNPELARIYQVEGVPDVKVAYQGQMHNGFVGMVPEPQLRELLGQLNLKSAWEEGLEAIEIAKDANNIPAVHHGYTTLIAQYPDRAELCLEAAAFYLKQGQFTEAEALLANIPPDQIAVVERATALQGIIQFHRDAATLTPDSAAAALYLAGAQAAIAQDYETALEKFLSLVQCDRAYQKDAGRKALLTLFTLLSSDHPLTREYRKRLMQALY